MGFDNHSFMHKFIITLAIVISSLISVIPEAQALGRDSKFEGMTLSQIADQTLSYALAKQIKTSDQNYVTGEFPTEIQSTLVPAIAGVGKMFGQDQEATAFTTASVINVLAQTYLSHKDLAEIYPSLQNIPQAIRSGVASFARYSVGPVFNFYPPHNENGLVTRRPVDLKLLPIWYGFTNIPNDADTSSVALSALMFDSKINGSKYTLSSEALAQFSQFRDVDRSPQFYNRRQNRNNTGAFMTWLYDEKNPNMPHFFLASVKKGERIPFVKNDVDCIVNANVIKLTALSKKQNIAGYKESCAMINDMIQKDEHAYCGIYYPNTYNLSFAMAAAAKAGDQCLNDTSKKMLVDKILSLQDGYSGAWSNDKNVWEDKTLSTAFAMQALLQFGDPYEYRVYVALLYGTHFLLSDIQYKKGPIAWPSDNFFTATAIARSLIMWRSEAYTNAIISDVFFKMQKLFPQFTAANYLKIDFPTGSPTN